MPRLSMWRPNKTNDYEFLDRNIREQFTAGGIDIYVHMFTGITKDDGEEVSINPPADEVTDPVPIEDLLFLENRHRNYADDIHIIRGSYRVQDLDFDLSQFGLFVAGDTLYIQFHYNDMIDILGRKFINGDVLEIPNLKDYHPLNQVIPAALPKFYVIQDGAFASEGFTATWLPHVWRVKCVPMKGGQEFKDVLDNCMDSSGGIDGDNGECNDSCTLGEWLCHHNTNLYINDGNLDEAHEDVPLSGYNNEKFFILGPDQDDTANVIRADNTFITVDSDIVFADNGTAPVNSEGYAVGYLTGNGLPPNGQPFTTGVSFPPGPSVGEYILRMDYVPHRLFQYDGKMWKLQEEAVRTDMYLGEATKTQRSSFVNNDEMVNTTDRGEIPSRQKLSELLRPKDDN